MGYLSVAGLRGDVYACVYCFGITCGYLYVGSLAFPYSINISSKKRVSGRRCGGDIFSLFLFHIHIYSQRL
uniref:Uncharacterized protein n=1 Tax=Rhizophora mucronata TaxID=61149 RepID=A0A2P2PKY3_RHIMU